MPLLVETSTRRLSEVLREVVMTVPSGIGRGPVLSVMCRFVTKTFIDTPPVCRFIWPTKNPFRTFRGCGCSEAVEHTTAVSPLSPVIS